MCSGRDEEVGHAAAMRSTYSERGGHNDCKAARGHCVEDDGVKRRFNHLESRLAPTALLRVLGQMWTEGEFGQGDGADG